MSMDDVVISFFVTGPETATLPLQVYSMLKMGVTPEINALCTVMLGTVFLLVAGARLFQSARKAKKRTVVTRTHRHNRRVFADKTHKKECATV